MSPGLPQAKNIDLVLSLLGLRQHYRVSGRSMLPLLKEGDLVFLARKKKNNNQDSRQDLLQPGSIIVFDDQGCKKIKKVTNVSAAEKTCIVAGINAAESEGARRIDRSQILGIVRSVADA